MKKFIALAALIALTASTALGLTISWPANDPAEQITSYKVYWAQGQNPFVLLANTGTNLSYTITNVVPGVYRFYVTAANFWSESDPSPIASTPPPATSPKGQMIYVIVGSKTNTIVNIQ